MDKFKEKLEDQRKKYEALKERAKTDKYLVTDASICLVCKEVYVRKTGGYQYQICDKCAKTLRIDMENWLRNGLYLVAPEEKEEEVK